MTVVLAIDPSIIAAYVGIAITAVLAIVAIVISVRSLGFQAETARAATISAEAAQRANYLTEQRLMNEVTREHEVSIGDDVGIHDGVVIDGGGADDGVRWSLDRKSKNSFLLRNVGTGVAQEVRIPEESAAKINRNLPVSATLRPGESVEFLMIPAMGAPVPNEIYVTWQGRDPDNPLVLPVPS